MDDISLSKLMIILDKLGLDIGDMLDHNFRIKLQKIVYLLRDLFNLDVGFSHSWYIKGPYCKKLADAGYFLNQSSDEKRNELKTKLNVSPRINTIINNAKGALQQYINDPKWLELIASIKYLKTYSIQKVSYEKIRASLLEKKPQLINTKYNGKSFDQAYKEAYNFIIENE